MAIYETAYDTTACSGSRVRKLVEDIQKAAVMGGLGTITVSQKENGSDFMIYTAEGGAASIDTVPFFAHPVFAKLNDTNELVVDIRAYGKYNAPQSQFVVRNGPEYAWSLKRAILNKLWVQGRTDAIRDLSPIPMAVYSSLISECIARRFALDPSEQMTVASLSAFFYYCLFRDTNFTEEGIHRMVGTIARNTRIPADKIYNSIGDLKMILDLDELCAVIRERCNNVALDNLNTGVLYAACCGNWFGTNAREILAVGLEHPPTFVMIVAASLESATYKRSTLAKISARYDKQGAGDNFIRSINVLLGGSEAIAQDAYGNFF